MPVEGQWQRTQTPLRRLTRRERNVAIGVLAITLAAIGAILLITAGDTRPVAAPGSGCIETYVAGRVGGEPVNGCGARAAAICSRASRFEDPRAEKIVEVCRQQRIHFDAAAAGR